MIIEEGDEELKFQQLPIDGMVVGDVAYWGHDELSSAYSVYDEAGQPMMLYDGCYMADDFADLKHSPVIRVKWWGSYLENYDEERVPRFLIAFEKDVPAQGKPGDADYIPSHPEFVIQSEIVHRAPTGAMPGPASSPKPMSVPAGRPATKHSSNTRPCWKIPSRRTPIPSTGSRSSP